MRGLVSTALMVATAVLGGCLDPTQITLTIRTNALCDDVEGTAITIGAPGRVEEPDPSASTERCTANDDGGRIGSLVLIPSDDKDAPVGVKVVASLGGDLDECIKPPYGDSCIIARRSLRYIPHTPLYLPVELDVDCVGKFCDELTTCVGGTCVDAAINPTDCIDPDGCEPEGAGGGGGEGGGGGGTTAPCDGPTTTAPITVSNIPISRAHLAIAADPAGCSFGIAWSEGLTESCMQLISPEGAPVAPYACEDRASIDDVDIASLGGGAWAVVDATLSQPGEARITARSSDGLISDAALATAADVSIAVQNDELLLVYARTDGSMFSATYGWSSSMLAYTGQATLTATGSRPAIAWAGGDVTMGWSSSPGGGGYVARFPFGTDPVQIAVPAASDIALSNHPPSGVTGLIFRNGGGVAALGTFAPGTYTSGQAPATLDANTGGFSVAGTTSGWVVSFVEGGAGKLTSYDASAVAQVVAAEVAPNVALIAVAAMGDQLGVAWIDTQGALYFRRVAFDLTTL